MMRITKEVILNMPPPEPEPLEESQWRCRLEQQVEDADRQGFTMNIPWDWDGALLADSELPQATQ